MHPHDYNARRQIAREHADELARDYRRAQKAAEAKPEHAEPASLLKRLRRPARPATQRP